MDAGLVTTIIKIRRLCRLISHCLQLRLTVSAFPGVRADLVGKGCRPSLPRFSDYLPPPHGLCYALRQRFERMTKEPTEPTPASEVSRYPYYATAEAYLRNFLGRGRGWHIKTRLHAEYRYSASLDVIVRRLAPHIYEVKAYPPDALVFAGPQDGLAIDELRGWIFVNDPRSRKSVLIASTQKVGLELYRLVKSAIRHEGKLARAEIYYRKLLASR
ncbi:hypothetical protein ES708_14380 [subsurface metagenome]